jgi:uncharacterized protein (DUF488 family)
MQKHLFTIGHSTHTLEHFCGLLEMHKVEVVCDVRSVPYSQHNPQFNREALKEQLHAVGVSYVFLGRELGARSDNSACYIDGKVQFNYLAEEPSFAEGMRRLRNGIDRFRIALMCAERDPLTCHRTILVCRELRAPDLNIEHILVDGSIETNSAAEKRLMSMLHIRPDMIQNEHDCIEQAYETQASNIAYVKPSKKSYSEPRNLHDENFHDRLHE